MNKNFSPIINWDNTNEELNNWNETPFQPQRIAIDIQTINQAIYMAENPIIPSDLLLQIIYVQVAQNARIMAFMKKRINLNVNKTFYIGKKKLEGKWFSDIITQSIMSNFFGHSAIHVYKEKNEIKTRIKRRFYVNPWLDLLLQTPGSPSGFKLKDPKIYNSLCVFKTDNLLGTKSECGFGIFYEIMLEFVMFYEARRSTIRFIDKYGLPNLWAKWTGGNSTDNQSILDQNVENALNSVVKNRNISYETFKNSMRDYVGGGYIITDKDEVESIETLNGDSLGSSWGVFKEFMEYNIKDVAALMLGHEDGLSATPGKLGSSDGENSPQQIALTETEDADLTKILNDLNDPIFGLIPKLYKMGIDVKLGDKIECTDIKDRKEKMENENLKKQIIENIGQMNSAGYSLDDKSLKKVNDILGFTYIKDGDLERF